MSFGGLTFDTQTVLSNSFNFDGGLLSQLKQFKNTAVRIVVSDVIVREIEKHLVDATKKAHDAVVLAHRDARRFGVLEIAPTPVADDVSAIAKRRLGQFLDEIGATVITTEAVSLEVILKHYFEMSPPFSSKKGKQKEFPDAVALAALEAYAEQKHMRLLAVSGDEDWQKFAANSKWIGHTKDLGEALQSFQKDLAAAIKSADAFLKRIEFDLDSDFSKRFREALSDEVSTQELDAEAETTDFNLARETLDVLLTDFRFTLNNHPPVFRVYRMQKDLLAIGLRIKCEVLASATFSVAATVPMGDVDAEETVEFETLFLVMFTGDLSKEEMTSISVDMVVKPRPLQFGNLDSELAGDEENYLPR